ncbi:MAG: VanZ family protein [Symploca sp. SIO1C4]|uniref:VanZ family protein n=1 Tax=Symploca sp. SIO1C4 TaxID=2607765 RepID=A0A6B3N7Z1_9CYAN|nr:VanZ family protein [Symploca sp. SIO1C4]
MTLDGRWTITFSVYLAILISISLLAYLGVLPTKISTIPYYDKILHFILVGMASYLSHKALGRKMISLSFLPFALPLAPLIITMLAAMDESLQALSPLRSCSLLDMSANLLGIWFFFWLVGRT